MPKEGHDDKGGGGSEIGGSPTGVDDLETVCRSLLLDNGSDTTERKQCHSLLDWLILRCNHQWQFMNLVGTPVTREVLVEEVLKIMNAVKDDVTDDDMVEELEKRGIVTDCHMNFVQDIRACALDVRNDDQCTMEELHRKLFPKTRRGKRDKYHPPTTTKKSGDKNQLSPPELKRQKCGRSDREEEEDPMFESGGEQLFQLGEDSVNAEMEGDLRGVEPTASVLRQSLSDPPRSSPKSKHCKNPKNGKRKRHKSTPKSKETRTEETEDPSTGARFVQNSTPLTAGLNGDVLSTNRGNNRTCVPFAIAALLQDHPDIIASLLSAMPGEGDMKTSEAEKALAPYGMWLERVGNNYNKKGGYPYHLLQEYNCNLIIHIKLTNTRKQNMFHCVSWDGKTIHDLPQSIKVNDTYDRRKPHLAKNVFNKLYPKDKFLSWQITNVFQLCGVVSGGPWSRRRN